MVMDRNSNDLTPREREALRDLADTSNVYDLAQEERVVRALADRGLLRMNRRTPWVPVVRIGVAAAALFMAFWIGTEYGKSSSAYVSPEMQQSPVEGEVTDEPGETFRRVTADEPAAFTYYRDEPDFPVEVTIVSSRSGDFAALNDGSR